jgi:predicted DNA-binding transcriptional regulator AlpA
MSQNILEKESWEILASRYVRTKEAAKIAKLSESVLNKMRLAGDGPEFCKAGPRIVVYRVQDILDWLESRKVRSTSEG